MKNPQIEMPPLYERVAVCYDNKWEVLDVEEFQGEIAFYSRHEGYITKDHALAWMDLPKIPFEEIK
jgi:hypothetical protein